MKLTQFLIFIYHCFHLVVEFVYLTYIIWTLFWGRVYVFLLEVHKIAVSLAYVNSILYLQMLALSLLESVLSEYENRIFYFFKF